jgi:hypothetical protein
MSNPELTLDYLRLKRMETKVELRITKLRKEIKDFKGSDAEWDMQQELKELIKIRGKKK